VNPTGISETLMKVRPGVEISGQSDIGCQRENNEDSFGYWEPEDDGNFFAKAGCHCGRWHGRLRRGPGSSHLAVETVLRFTATRTATIRNRH